MIVWRTATGEMIRRVTGNAGPLERVAMSPDEARIVTAGRDCYVRLWDAGTGEELLTLSSHHSGVDRLLIGSDGRRLLTVGGDWRLLVWDCGDRPSRENLRRFAVDCPATRLEIRSGECPDRRFLLIQGINRSQQSIIVPASASGTSLSFRISLHSISEPERPRLVHEVSVTPRVDESIPPGEPWSFDPHYETPRLEPGRYRITVRSEWANERRAEQLSEIAAEFEIGVSRD